MKNNNGFTLIELLAVIVILAILMGIIALNFSNIFSSTQDKVYKTYEDSMKTAAIEYIIDSGETPTKSTPLIIRLAYFVGDEARKNPLTGVMEKAKPAYIDHFHNPKDTNDCTLNSFVKVEIDPEKENRERTDEEGRTDNNKNYLYKVCLYCENSYISDACNE